METYIRNRKDQKISVLVEQAADSKGLVFIAHGLGGFKDEPHIQKYAQTFKDNNFTIVRFDATNACGKSDGNYEHATVTNYYEDLEDTISWAATQAWYQEPFWLAGHSMGSMTSILFAQRYPDKVKALAPTSAVISGSLSLEGYRAQGYDIEQWKQTGWLDNAPNASGQPKRLPWSHMADRLMYNVLEHTDKLTMPVLMIVGDKDLGTPVAHQKILYERLPGKKELHVINGAEHTFRTPEHLAEIKNIFDRWINNNF